MASLLSLGIKECFNAQTEQTANLILESHCRWVAMLTGFSVSIYQSTLLWHNVLMHQCPHQPTSSKHKVKCVFFLLCCVTLGWRGAAGRGRVIMCCRWGTAGNKWPLFMSGFICLLRSEGYTIHEGCAKVNIMWTPTHTKRCLASELFVDDLSCKTAPAGGHPSLNISYWNLQSWIIFILESLRVLAPAVQHPKNFNNNRKHKRNISELMVSSEKQTQHFFFVSSFG